MRSEHILMAMNSIDDMYILAAQDRLGYFKEEQINPPVGYHWIQVFRKIVVLLAAMVLLMSAILVTAMTVDEDFRELVFEFLHIE